MRYTAIDGSESGHCCFKASVVDTEQPVMINGEHYEGRFETVCECFDREDADMIAAALNAKASQ